MPPRPPSRGTLPEPDSAADEFEANFSRMEPEPEPEREPEPELEREPVPARHEDPLGLDEPEPEPEPEPAAPDEQDELLTTPQRDAEAVRLQRLAALDRDDAELHVVELERQQGLFTRQLSTAPEDDELAALSRTVSVTLAELNTIHNIHLGDAPLEPEPELAPDTGEHAAAASAAKVTRLLSSVPIFAALASGEPEFAHRLALKLRTAEYVCGDTVLGLGERSGELFLLASGAVKVRGETEEEQAEELTAGAFNLSILGLCQPLPMTATVFATRHSRFLQLSQHDLREVVRQFKGFEEYMIATDGGQHEGNAKLQRSASGWRLAQALTKQISPLLLKSIKDQQDAERASLASIGALIAKNALAGGPASPAPPPPPNFWRDHLEQMVAYPLLIDERVKKEIRLGVPQPYRRVVWLRLSGAEESCRGDYDGYYEAALRLCFKLDKLPAGGDYPTVVGKFPTFGGELVQYEWLTEDHHQAAKRLLLTLKQFEAKMNFCPMLPAVLCALLQALSEPEVYAVVLALVDRSLKQNTQPKLPHFQLTQQQETIFELTFYDIASSYAGAAVRALKEHLAAYPPEKDGQDDFWDTWKHSFFCNKLPLQSVLKVVDIWMSEGHKAIFRVALALLKEHTTQLCGASDRMDAMDVLCPITPLLNRVPIDDNRLLVQAFKMHLSRKQLQNLDKANEGKAGEAVSLRPVVTHFHKPHWSATAPIVAEAPASSILSQMQLEALWELLPPMLEPATPQLLYSSSHHGYALQRMYERCKWANGDMINSGGVDHAGVLLVIQTVDGNIIGGFCDRKLTPVGAGVKYSGRRGCFVFVFTPGLEVEAKAYRWSGLNEMFWRMLEPQGTAEQRAQGKARPASVSLGGGTDSTAGVGYALYLDADGQGGSTAACETFACPSLINPDDPFMKASSPVTNHAAGSGGAGSGPVTFDIATSEIIILTDVPCSF